MTTILIDFYMATVDLGLGPRMIQLAIYAGLLKPGIQCTKSLYQDHLPSITFQATVSEAFVLQKLFIIILIASKGVKRGCIFNFCPVWALTSYFGRFSPMKMDCMGIQGHVDLNPRVRRSWTVCKDLWKWLVNRSFVNRFRILSVSEQIVDNTGCGQHHSEDWREPLWKCIRYTVWCRCSAVWYKTWLVSVVKTHQRGKETYSYCNENSAMCYNIRRRREETTVDLYSTASELFSSKVFHTNPTHSKYYTIFSHSTLAHNLDMLIYRLL